jgi:hypothetical protein
LDGFDMVDEKTCGWWPLVCGRLGLDPVELWIEPSIGRVEQRRT